MSINSKYELWCAFIASQVINLTPVNTIKTYHLFALNKSVKGTLICNTYTHFFQQITFLPNPVEKKLFHNANHVQCFFVERNAKKSLFGKTQNFPKVAKRFKCKWPLFWSNNIPLSCEEYPL